MSLDWNVGKVKNYRKLCFNADNSVNYRTEALIEATHFIVGLDEITAKNAEEFFRRLSLHESTFGSLTFKGRGQPTPFTLDDVKAHIGLYTNASRKTKREWEKAFKEKKAQHEQNLAALAR